MASYVYIFNSHSCYSCMHCMRESMESNSWKFVMGISLSKTPMKLAKPASSPRAQNTALYSFLLPKTNPDKKPFQWILVLACESQTSTPSLPSPLKWSFLSRLNGIEFDFDVANRAALLPSTSVIRPTVEWLGTRKGTNPLQGPPKRFFLGCVITHRAQLGITQPWKNLSGGPKEDPSQHRRNTEE